MSSAAVNKLLPTRRASASAGHASSPVAPRTHRTNDSHHVLTTQTSSLPQSISSAYSTTAGSATPQQKVVHALVNRLKNRLPCHSGLSLTAIEAENTLQQAVEALIDLSRHSLDIIAWALTELVDKLSKQTDQNGFRTIDVLQSQLFTLKVLSVAMAHRFQNPVQQLRENQRPGSRTGKHSNSPGSAPASPAFSAPGHPRKSRQASAEHLTSSSVPTLVPEPAPLDDACAKYILSVMILLIRQTAPPEDLHYSNDTYVGASVLDFESVELEPMGPTTWEPYVIVPQAPSSSKSGLPRDYQNPSSASVDSSGGISIPLRRSAFVFQATPQTLATSSLSLNILISKFAGHIIYHLSVSNWNIVFSRIRNRIHFIAGSTEDSPDTIDMRLVTHCALDRSRLMQVLQELSSLLVNMKKDSQNAVAVSLRTAIWHWIEIFPQEYNETVNAQRRMEGAPERVFDLLFQIMDANSRAVIWPTLTVLMCISPERIKHADKAMNPSANTRVSKKEGHLLEQLQKNLNTSSKLGDVAMMCMLDICKAAIRIQPENDSVLRSYASDIADDIKTRLWKHSGQRPFYESGDEIDVALYAEALVTIFRFLPEEESLSMFSACLEPERSDAVKICVAKACLTLVIEAPRMPGQPPLRALQELVSPRFRSIFTSAMLRRSEVDPQGSIKRANPRPNARRYTSETISDRELLLVAIMSLWRTEVGYFFCGSKDSEIAQWSREVTQIMQRRNDTAVRISASRTFGQQAKTVLSMTPSDDFFQEGLSWISHASRAALVSSCTALLDARDNFEAQRLAATSANGILGSYLAHACAEHKTWQLSTERTHAFALAEIAFLVSLTSADTDVVTRAAQGLRLLALLERQPDAPQNPGLTEDERAKRYPIYEQLGDKKVMVVGRVGQQKRVRKLVRLIASPAPIHIAVWEECYWRWSSLNDSITRVSTEYIDDSPDVPVGDRSLSEEMKRLQWQNLTLFLAAFGAACTSEEFLETSLAGCIAPQYLPDRLRVLQEPEMLMKSFITNIVDMLVIESVPAREVAKDALGSELSPRLYARLFRHINQLMDDITKHHDIPWADTLAVLLDQFIAILKLLVDRVEMPTEDVLVNIDMSGTLLAIAQLVARFNEPSSLRIRLKFCGLCDSVLGRSDTLALSRDDNVRNNLLDVVFDWSQDPTTSNDTEFVQVQEDINMACLRTVTKLMDRLRLQPLDASAGDDSSHVVRLFVRYSTALIRILDFPLDRSEGATEVPHKRSSKEVEMRHLVASALSNLLSANSDHGFKHCLPFAYETDLRKRSVFVDVFARVLGQGTRFDPHDEAVVAVTRSRLCELVKCPDMILALAICETCPSSEVDMIIPVLLNIFDTRASLMGLLQAMIDREIANTDNAAQLFRGNTMCTRLLSAFAKIHGYSYLRSLIEPLIKTMTSMPPGGGYELDPAKALDQDVRENQKNVELVASSFIEIICSSVPAIPPMFHEICAYIAKSVYEVWPEAKYAAMGAFMFLRFISPGIVAPDTVDVEIPKEDNGVIRRGLMVIAKIVQNLANNIFFGKEQHMIVLNDFLHDNVVNVMRYLHDIEKYSAVAGPEEEIEEWVSTAFDETDTIVLHRFFERHADKVGKELLSTSKPIKEDDATSIGGKRAWNALCASLVDLGDPIEVPRISPLTSFQHQEYIDFMARFRNRSTESVKAIFKETSISEADTVVFVLSVAEIDVEALDVELLLFHIFKTLMSPGYKDSVFEVIVDCTASNSLSEFPVQRFKRCTELIPSDIRARFAAAYFLNPSISAQRYMRKLYNISGGLSLASSVRAFASVEELLQHVPLDDIDLLLLPWRLEQEPYDSFSEVSLRHSQHMRMPVTLEVGLTHLRITSVKPQPVSPSLTCKSTEIIQLIDVGDVYNVSTGHDPYEFIIRRSRHGGILYFSSPLRDIIVKTIRSAKSALKREPKLGAERFSRSSNVVASLLHIGMLNITQEDVDLKAAAYDLLSAACSYLQYEGKPVLPSRAAFISGHPTNFVTHLSERLSATAPRLTLEFLTEFAVGMEKATVAQRINCLQYMSPWVKNISLFPNPSSPHYEHSGARLRDCTRALIDLTVSDKEVYPMVQKYIWGEVGKLDSVVVNVVLDELIRAAIDGGVESRRCDLVADTAAAFSSINVRGRIFTKLRKVLGKTALKPTRTLPENVHWNELACLIRLALVAGYHWKQTIHSQMYAPEIVHLVTMLAGTGQTVIRTSVYGIVMNLLQSLSNARPEDVANAPEIGLLVDECSQPKVLRLFGLSRTSSSNEYTTVDPASEQLAIDCQEELAHLLIRILEISAGSKGLLNVWRARWMSLVTSTAFQLSPVMQSRAFVVLGTLATSDVDDDLLYQMLVAFRNALSQSTETDTLSVVCMLRCMCKVVPSLQEHSRYLPQMFWLAVALLQSSHIAFYVESTNLLRAALVTLAKWGSFNAKGVSATLLEGRVGLDDVGGQLDQILGLSFDSSFSFSLASIIFKGVRHPTLYESARAALQSLLRVTADACVVPPTVPDLLPRPIAPEAVGYFLALIPLSSTFESYRALLDDAKADAVWYSEDGAMPVDEDSRIPRVPFEFLGPIDTNSALLITSFTSVMLSTAQGEDAETQMLYSILSDAATYYPETVSLIYEGLQDKIRDTFANSSNPATLSAASNIFRVAVQDPGRTLSPRGSASTLSTVDEGGSPGPGRNHLMALEELNMQGLASNFQFLPPNRGHATKMINWIPELVVRIIQE